MLDSTFVLLLYTLSNEHVWVYACKTICLQIVVGPYIHEHFGMCVRKARMNPSHTTERTFPPFYHINELCLLETKKPNADAFIFELSKNKFQDCKIAVEIPENTNACRGWYSWHSRQCLPIRKLYIAVRTCCTTNLVNRDEKNQFIFGKLFEMRILLPSLDAWRGKVENNKHEPRSIHRNCCATQYTSAVDRSWISRLVCTFYRYTCYLQQQQQ